ncbi:ABC transporter permease subunit [Prosthecomicrobium pneumaticum]|uniref:Ribose transport system permease protein n=1 Tax=Prosthecomicrobium pneumaticum TaxID=81895 RepID=A0A7W9L3S1_9HYPH|nr:ribose transport system permease protein [Prosthecomicrobium pneumaticum]
MNSIETAAAARKASSTRSPLGHLLSHHALLIILVALVIAFSLIRPNTFPTALTFRGIVDTKSVVVLVSLGIMLPLTTNQFDLSAGYIIALTNSLVVGLMINAGLPWPVAILAVLVVGGLVGVANGWLVAYAQIDSFIATLGSGTVLFGLANWYTGGQQLSGRLDPGFIAIAAQSFGIPHVALIALAVALVLWVFLEYLPAGRRFYAVGANRRAAELSGINARRRIVIAFTVSGVCAAMAGVIFASQLRVGQTNTGPDMLLPVFAAALLGSTSVRPGRVNVWGTVIAVALLAVAVSGLQQMGAQFYVEYIFNGGILVFAVGAAGFMGRRRAAARRAAAAEDAVRGR